MSKDFMDDRFKYQNDEKIVPELKTVMNEISLSTENPPGSEVGQLLLKVSSFNQSIQELSHRMFFWALALAFLLNFLTLTIIMRIQASHWNWLNPGHLSQLFQMIIAMSLHGFLGSIVFAFGLWRARVTFRNQPSRFFITIQILLVLGAISPILLVLPKQILLLINHPSLTLGRLFLQEWISYCVVPGLTGGIAFFLSLMFLTWGKTRLMNK